MTIIIKNKATLLFDDFKIKCSVGKKGFSIKKKKEIILHQGVLLILEIYIIAPIDCKNLFLNSNVSK